MVPGTFRVYFFFFIITTDSSNSNEDQNLNVHVPGARPHAFSA